jgi:hypothetical protein
MTTDQPEVGKQPRAERLAVLRKPAFWLAFFLWFLVNGLIWYVITGGTFLPAGMEDYIWAFSVTPLNVLVVVVMSVIRGSRPAGLGLLAAMLLNLVISTALGALGRGVFAVPFFVDFN